MFQFTDAKANSIINIIVITGVENKQHKIVYILYVHIAWHPGFKLYSVHVAKYLRHAPPPKKNRNKYRDFKLYGVHLAKSFRHTPSPHYRNMYHYFKLYGVQVSKSLRHATPSPSCQLK